MNRHIHRRGLVACAAALTVIVLAGCTGEPSRTSPAGSQAGYPVSVSSCGFTAPVPSKPGRAVTLNQGATEIALALGVQGQLAGTAYLDDQIAPRWRTAYQSVKVLAPEYPTREALLAARPDFVYASYASAFTGEVAGTQSELNGARIPSYLSPFGCDSKALRPKASFEAVWTEIDSVARAFGVPERAAQIRRDQQSQLDALAHKAHTPSPKIVWIDMIDKAPSVGAGAGGPQLVMRAAGATNVFAHLSGSWGDAKWEDVVKADPDAIVLIETAKSSGADKAKYLRDDPVLSQLRAAKTGALITIPFSESTVGVRLVDGAQRLSDALAQLPTPTR